MITERTILAQVAQHVVDELASDDSYEVNWACLIESCCEACGRSDLNEETLVLFGTFVEIGELHAHAGHGKMGDIDLATLILGD